MSFGAGESFRRPYAGEFEDRRAVYTGHARLWQGASVLEAETIELLGRRAH